MDMIKIGEFLAKLRKEQGWTQEQLGEKLGVTNKTVSRWEKGNYLPPVEMLQMMSEVYGLTINEILSGERLTQEQYRQKAEENIKTALSESAFTLQNTLYTQYFGAQYAAWHEKLVEIYSRYNNELGHTFNQRMVNHEIVADNLSCTEYEDGTKVYVNYSYENKTTPEGNNIPARDYFVMK